MPSHGSLSDCRSEGHREVVAREPLLNAVFQVAYGNAEVKPGLSHALDIPLGRDDLDFLRGEFGSSATGEVEAQFVHHCEGLRVLDGDHHEVVGFGLCLNGRGWREPLEEGGEEKGEDYAHRRGPLLSKFWRRRVKEEIARRANRLARFYD